MVKESLPPQTTEQQDITFAGQRRVNLIWEFTQAGIASSVTGATVIALLRVVFQSQQVDENQLTALMQLVGMTLLILGFYFSRTNHAAIGGIGAKPNQPYVGR